MAETAGTATKRDKRYGYWAEKRYGYWDAGYALQNEWVGISESTCSARLYALPLGDPSGKGTALFQVGELTRLALERCQTARCSVKLMGQLAEDYGCFLCDVNRFCV